MKYKNLLAVFILITPLTGYAFADALVSGLIAGWQHSENTNSIAVQNSSNAPVTKTEEEVSSKNLRYIKSNSSTKLYTDNNYNQVKKILDGGEAVEILFTHYSGWVQVKVSNEIGWVLPKNIVDSYDVGVYEQRVKVNSNHKNPTDRWVEEAKKYIKPVKSIRGIVPLTSNVTASDSDTATTKISNIDKFLNDFNSKENAISATPIVYSYGNSSQEMLLDELSDGFENLQRQQKKELKRQNQKIKKMLEQQNRDL